ncbi:hypothetical protein [Ferruginibacter sp.]
MFIYWRTLCSTNNNNNKERSMQLQQQIPEEIQQGGKLVYLVAGKNRQQEKKQKISDGKARIIRMRTAPQTSVARIGNKCAAFLKQLFSAI